MNGTGGRTAILTGAASPRGIGRATAARLAAAGWNIGIIDVDPSGAATVAEEVAAEYGVRSAGAGADVSVPAEVNRAFDLLEAELPPLGAVVALAGVASPVPYEDVDEAEWRRVLSINLDGVHHTLQRGSATLAAAGWGRMVSLSSISAQRGGGTFSKAPYSAAKAGVIGLTRALARELGPHGVTVNAVAPGPIDTDIMGGTLSEEKKAELAAGGVLPRIGTPTDVAAAIEYLVSEDAGFVTGQTLNVDGGLYMH